jgi:hypothetical protein
MTTNELANSINPRVLSPLHPAVNLGDELAWGLASSLQKDRLLEFY